jgi:hypothetical protein
MALATRHMSTWVRRTRMRAGAPEVMTRVCHRSVSARQLGTLNGTDASCCRFDRGIARRCGLVDSEGAIWCAET